MSSWEVFHKVLESAYLLSGVAIALMAGIGLRQLRIAKESITKTEELARLSAKRDSFQLAAEACNNYMREIIPILDKTDRLLDSAGFSEKLDAFRVEFSEAGFSVKPPTNHSKVLDQLIEN